MRAAVFLILSNWQNIGKSKISREGNKQGERERERKKNNCRSATVGATSPYSFSMTHSLRTQGWHPDAKVLLPVQRSSALCLPPHTWISHIMLHYETALPSPGMILSETVFPASLIRLTMSECDLLVMEQQLTANIRSPTFSFPQRSAGLPSMMRPILWGMATHAFPAFVLTYMFVLRVYCVCQK